jgi:hypothetical protein
MPSAQTNAGFPVGTQQVDLGVAVAEHVHMGGLMVIAEDHDAQPVRPKDGDHDST